MQSEWPFTAKFGDTFFVEREEELLRGRRGLVLVVGPQHPGSGHMDRESVTAKELTMLILTELKKVNEQWYRNWIVFDQAVKRRRTEEELQ